MSKLPPTPLMDKPGVYFLDSLGYGKGAGARSRTCIVYAFGRVHMHAVTYIKKQLRCVEIERDAQLRPVLLAGLPYPIKKAVRSMLKSKRPITDTAKVALHELLESQKEPTVA